MSKRTKEVIEVIVAMIIIGGLFLGLEAVFNIFS